LVSAEYADDTKILFQTYIVLLRCVGLTTELISVALVM